MFQPQPTIETKTETSTQKDEGIEQALKIWEENKNDFSNIMYFKETYTNACSKNLPALSPVQLQQLPAKIQCVPEKSASKGIYLTALIQKSYNSGYNNFTFTNENPLESIDYFLAYLQATPERPLIVTNHASQGFYCGYETINVQLTNYGTIKRACGEYSTNMRITNQGIIGSIDLTFKGTIQTIHANEYKAFINEITWLHNPVIELITPTGEIIQSNREKKD